jgi:type I restriction enzyme M protein
MVSEARNGLGQYLTPMPVAEMIAAVCSSMKKGGTVMDPFCGSGLLLDCLGSLDPSASLIGVEINEPIARVSKALSLLSPSTIDVMHDDAFVAWEAGRLPKVDVVVTNPPFGAIASTLDPASATSIPRVLTSMRSIPAELLGLELSASVLKPDGFLGIVVPQSVLTNSRWEAYRSHLFRRIEIVAVVSLPESTFMPFRGVARACVLFARKRGMDLPATVPFWRSVGVGYDDTGRPHGNNDLPIIGQAIIEGKPASAAVLQGSGAVKIGPADVPAPDAFRCHVLGHFATVFTGKNPPRDSYVDEGPWILKVGDLASGVIAWRNRRRTHQPVEWFNRNSRYHLKRGDICLTAAGHRPRYIGLKVDLIDEVPEAGAMPSGEVMVIRLHEGAPFPPELLLFYLRSKAGYGQIQDLVRGSTGHLYPKDVEGLLLPPLEEHPSAEIIPGLFHDAARAFRQYLRLEAEVTEIAMGDGKVLPDD